MAYPYDPPAPYTYKNLTLKLADYKPESELEIQRMVENWCVRHGGDPYVMNRICRRAGYPDNLIRTPSGVLFYIEFKKPYAPLQKHQAKWIAEGLRAGKIIFIVDDADVGVKACNVVWDLHPAVHDRSSASDFIRPFIDEYGRKGAQSDLLTADVRVFSGTGPPR